MKDKFSSIALAVSGLIAASASLPNQAFAAAPFECDKLGQFKPLCILNADNFGSLIANVINIIFVVAVIAALFYLIWGGIKYLISEGEKAAVQEARDHIVAAIIGLIIVFMSYFVLSFVLFFFTGSSLNEIKIPQLTK